MKEKHIQILSIVLTTTAGVFIAFLYIAEPKSLEDVSAKAISTIESAASRGQVIIGTYEIDQIKFNEGLQAFRADNFTLARDRFEKSDPEKRDAKVQFYIAYSFYRQGWGRVSNDDALFKQGIEILDRVKMLDANFRSDDANLALKTAPELRNELDEGLRVTPDDFNPLKVFRERK